LTDTDSHHTTTDVEAPLVSVLFVTYKRFDLLKKAVESFQRNTAYPNLELVITDDGSGPEIQAQIRTLRADVFALLPKNRGLGANNNNGIRRCNGKYILMIQDDWECRGPADYLANAVAVLEANPRLGFIHFAGAPHPSDLAQPLQGSAEPCYVVPRPHEDGRAEIFFYSDQPHIQSRASFDHVGYYKEDRDMDKCEIDYNRRWKNQTQFLTAAFPAYYMKVFSNEGEALQRSFRTTRFRNRISRLFMPAKPFLTRHANPIFRLGKVVVQGSIYTLEKLRIVR
jgi:glycosyltransferase involved in cell wall biosynthesis